MASNNGRIRESTFYKEVLPFAAMVSMECINVGLNTLYKAATNKGMSNHVFVVYSYGLAAVLLLPSPFFSTRSRVLPPLNCSILAKIFLLGVIGCTSQIMGYTGINYSSPTLASAISNLVPAFTFVLAVTFRMEKIELKRSSTRAKVLGTVVSIAGAFVVTLYKGPKLLVAITSTPNFLSQSLRSSQSNWMLGGLFLTTEYFLVPMWYIVQTWIMKEYPAEVTVVFFYNLCVSCLAAIVGFFTEPDSNKWRIKPDIALVSILCSGILGSSLNNTIHTWALRVKGPVYVAMFKPLSIAIAVAMGVIILGDTLYLGSVLGATVIAIGFYTVMWGKAKEMPEYDDSSDLESSSAQKFPLLHNYKNEGISNK
ncbi:WAT1-related protein At3g28050-like isoform X1 [Nicotiana tomentosiformis]|uniref:WAT1-related protein At3g28050-like isoform X1 n=1 Tax=Nicotiana tomentosiformis TaxID=4098 RepID=UPI00051BDCDF|nr:WAT1-related protein At3g28050-like isoform X1 [Nicotiana tomentosiformis]